MRFGAFLTAVLMLEANAVATTSAWNYSAVTDNTTPQMAADWFADGNWDGDVPNAMSDRADMRGASGSRYVKIGKPVSFSSLSGTYLGNNRLTLIGDGPIALEVPSGTVCDISNVISYVPLSWTGLLGNTSYFFQCNPSVTGDEFVIGGGYCHWDFSMYAESTADAAGGDIDVKRLRHGSADCIMYSPKGAVAPQTSSWTVSPGSAYVTAASQDAGFVAVPGSIIESEAFPSGTFVKAVYPDGILELSATADVSSMDVSSITFLPHSPMLSVRIPEYVRSTYVDKALKLNAYASCPAMRLEFDRFTANGHVVGGVNTNSVLTLDTDSNFTPGTLVVHDAANAKITMNLGYCHIELAETASETYGFPLGEFRIPNAGSVATITVTNGLSAEIGCFSRLMGTLVKDGAGSLRIGNMGDDSHSGKLVVEGGTLELPECAGIGSVTVSSGATLKINGNVSLDTLVAHPGASIIGDGMLSVGNVGSLNGVKFSHTVTLRIVGGTGELLTEKPEYAVVGDPAFWVDASAKDSVITKDNDGLNVMRINDVRKMSEVDGYLFATNVVLTPTVLTPVDGRLQLIDFGDAVGTVDIANVRELVWSSPITNITAIFQVQDCGMGGGQFLGSSARLHTLLNRQNDFAREPNGQYDCAVFFQGNNGTYQRAVMDGMLMLNGESSDYRKGYLYGNTPYNCGGSSGKMVYAPQLAESYPTMPVAADTFAFDYATGKYTGRNGRKRLSELIVYTNSLTKAQVLAVRGYLMKKWVNCDIDCAVSPNGDMGSIALEDAPGFFVEDGENLAVSSVAGAGTLMKAGNGKMYIDVLSGGMSTLDVKGGTLIVNSRTAPTAADLPVDGLLMRMDASDVDRQTVDSSTGKVIRWESSHGDMVWNCFDAANVRREGQANGLALIDLGQATKVTSYVQSGGFSYDRNSNMRTIFMVQDTAQGGTSLVGNKTSYNYEGIIRGDWYTRYSDDTYQYPKDAPIVPNDCANGVMGILGYKGARGCRVRLNCEDVAEPQSTGFTGGLDILSFVSYGDISSDCFGYNRGHFQVANGGMLGEYIVYTNGLCKADVRKVEAYLRKKWQCVDSEGFSQAEVRDLAIGPGAALQINGGAPLSISGEFSGSGVVYGSIAMSAGSVLNIAFAKDGTLNSASVSGTFDISACREVRVSAENFMSLKPGVYDTVVAAGGIIGSIEGMVVAMEGAGASKCRVALSVKDGRIVLGLYRVGLRVNIR